jgi:hypothetical protein
MAKQRKAPPPFHGITPGMNKGRSRAKPTSDYKTWIVATIVLMCGLSVLGALLLKKSPEQMLATQTVPIVVPLVADVVQPTSTVTEIPVTNTAVVTLSFTRVPPTVLPSATITETPQPILSATTAASPAAQAIDIQSTGPTTYYAPIGGINVRSCPQKTCEVVVKIDSGASIVSDGYVNGEAVNAGNTIWYHVVYNAEDAYVYSGVVTAIRPSTTTTVTSNGSTTNNTTIVIQQSVPPAQVWDCNGNRYDCSSFTSRSAMDSYWAACPGDPSHLDGNGDGEYCEGP